MTEALYVFWIIFVLASAKYFVMFGIPYLVFWKWKPKSLTRHKIQIIERNKPQVGLELKYSIMTLFIQSGLFLGIYYGWIYGYFPLYSGFLTYGWQQALISFVCYFLIYDPYFYLSHRLLHYGWFYKNAHMVHHRSSNPTPLAGYSFHPIETVINLLYFIPFLYFVPTSFEMFFVLLIITDIGNLGGHLGYELLPRSSWNTWLAWLTTPTHHNIHHQLSHYNFGLYWRGWDQIFKTMHPKTEQEFYKIKDQAG